MSIMNEDSPFVSKLNKEDYCSKYNTNENNDFIGFVAYCKNNDFSSKEIRIQKVFIDEVYAVKFHKEERILFGSVSYMFENRVLFNKFNKNANKKRIYLDKPFFSNDFYSTYNPTDKIKLEDIGKTEEEALKAYIKRENKDLYQRIFLN